MTTNKTEKVPESDADKKCFPDQKTLQEFDVKLQDAQKKLHGMQEEMAQALAAIEAAKTPHEQMKIIQQMHSFPEKISKTQENILTTTEDIVACFTKKTD